MFTLTCSLLFRDGQKVTAQVEAISKTEDVLVHYAGPVKRLPLVAPRVTAVELRAYFKSFARELKAQYTEVEIDDRVVPPRQLDEALEYLVALGGLRRARERADGDPHRRPKEHKHDGRNRPAR